jgi:hypothetical protein
MTLANKNKIAARVGLGTFVQVCGFPPIRLKDVEWMGYPAVVGWLRSQELRRDGRVSKDSVGWLRFEKLRLREPADVDGI